MQRIPTAPILPALLAFAAASALGAAAPAAAQAPAAVVAAALHPGDDIALNDNRRPAGELRGGVLTLRLIAREGTWYPEGPESGRPVAAWGEEGRPLQNPGPLIRVPAGTEVRASVRNSLARPLTVFGLGARRGLEGDSVTIEPGGVRELRFRAADPGTYYYAGKTTPAPPRGRGTRCS